MADPNFILQWHSVAVLSNGCQASCEVGCRVPGWMRNSPWKSQASVLAHMGASTLMPSPHHHLFWSLQNWKWENPFYWRNAVGWGEGGEKETTLWGMGSKESSHHAALRPMGNITRKCFEHRWVDQPSGWHSGPSMWLLLASLGPLLALCCLEESSISLIKKSHVLPWL